MTWNRLRPEVFHIFVKGFRHGWPKFSQQVCSTTPLSVSTKSRKFCKNMLKNLPKSVFALCEFLFQNCWKIKWTYFHWTVKEILSLTLAYNMSFCVGRPNGNYEHETYKAYFYACSNYVTSLLHCNPLSLWFDKSCDACVYQWQYGTFHSGKKR